MAQLDALRVANMLRRRLVDFAADDAFVRDPRMGEAIRAIWGGDPARGGLVSDLWVEGAFPAELSTDTTQSLVAEGLLDADLMRQLDRAGAVPRQRPLYTHQAEAVRSGASARANSRRPGLVVTAPTGAGKTEAFLLPVLNDLFATSADNQPGVKCLVLYPMNALVNDQVDRLYGWLRGQDRVRLFHFTGDTPEDYRRANQDGVPVWDASRVRTRQQARGLEDADGRPVEPAERGRVPDIVITNYSMLEYMLCRPQDAVFFGSALRAVVLDEAHLYTGTLAAEITLLLRRVLLRCERSPDEVLTLATSATLGGGSESELREFASTLFSKSSDLVEVIQGRPAPLSFPEAAPPGVSTSVNALLDGDDWLDRSLVEYEANGDSRLTVAPELATSLSHRLPSIVAASIVEQIHEDRPAALLADVLPAAPIVQHLGRVLWERGRLPLTQLSAELWQRSDSDAVRATVRLLQLAASARSRPSDYPVVPHRLHVVVRAPDGLVACLNQSCSGPSELRISPLGALSEGNSARCCHCGNASLALFRCSNCGAWMLAGEQDDTRLRPPTVAPPRPPQDTVRVFTLAARPGAQCLTIRPSDGETSGVGSAGLPVWETTGCPECAADRDELRPFATGTPLSLSIVAETVLAELPPFPSAGNTWLPARGRRLLAFSDSRPEAARLGPRLTRQHETQLVRAALALIVSQSLAADPETVELIRAELEMYTDRLTLPSITPAQRQYFEQQRDEKLRALQAMSAGGSMADWARALQKQSVLAEVLDPETSTRHTAADWDQADFDANRERVAEHASVLLAREFASPTRRAMSAETLGLAQVTYPGLEALEPPPAYVGQITNASARDALHDAWPEFLAMLCDTLRLDGVISVEGDEADQAYQFGGVPVGRWSAQHDTGPRLIRFVGETKAQRRCAFAAAVLRAAHLSAEEADAGAAALLDAAFGQLFEYAADAENGAAGGFAWLQKTVRQTKAGPPSGAIRLVFQELGLRRPPAVFRCAKTGQVWTRSVLACAPAPGSSGTLQQVSEVELDTDPRIGRQRREYFDSPVFRMGLWAAEHSAQLSAKETRRLQDLFKGGIRNVLSATTTLELGIDIGGLNAVLMSNVPPGKANYLQRAGRAGRRADGSSLVVTFARPQPFDREVFKRIGEYLGRELRRPLVFLDRQRVVRRHLHAFLLGEFFRAIFPPDVRVGAMNAFGNMGVFCGVPLPARWDRSAKEKPPAVQPQPMELLAPTVPPWWNPALRATGPEAQYLSFLYWARDWGERQLRPAFEHLLRQSALEAEVGTWGELIERVVEDFASAVRAWRSDYDNLLLSWYVSEQRIQANAIRYQLSAQYEVTVIEALADRQFLPHYGFPIGVHKLRVIVPDESRRQGTREEDQFRLERASLMALREYVPGSQLLVGGKLVTSHGLLKHWTGQKLDTYVGLRGRYGTCENGHFYYSISEEVAECPLCQAGPRTRPLDLLFPKHGFSGAAWDPPRWSMDVERVGTAQTATMTFAQDLQNESIIRQDDFAGVARLRAMYREAGELLVYNSGENRLGFAICLSCGYADSEAEVAEGMLKLPSGFVQHAPLHEPNGWKTCFKDGKGAVLRNQTLGARETTDVLLIDFSSVLGSFAADESLVTTLGYALSRAGVETLELDGRELGVMVVPTGPGGRSRGALLYDSTPGGAGHVRELLAQGREWFERARSVLFVDAAHDARCETACLDCLLSFSAQEALRQNLLNRPAALAVLDQLLSGSVPDPDLSAEVTLVPQTVHSVSTAERRQRAEQRSRGLPRNCSPS